MLVRVASRAARQVATLAAVGRVSASAHAARIVGTAALARSSAVRR